MRSGRDAVHLDLLKGFFVASENFRGKHGAGCCCETHWKVSVWCMCVHTLPSLLDIFWELVSSCGPLLAPCTLSLSFPLSVACLSLQLSPPIAASIHYISHCCSCYTHMHTHFQRWGSLEGREIEIWRQYCGFFYLHLLPHFHFILIPPHTVSPIYYIVSASLSAT